MAGKKILMLSNEFGTEQDELVVPYEQLKAKGHDVTLATPDAAEVQTLVGDQDPGKKVAADTALASVTGEYDVIVLPGGTINADNARIDEKITSLVSEQAKAGRTIAAICHAPWILINAGIAESKTLTSYESIQLDLQNAGATWKDVEVFVCTANGYKLITSRNPGDLDAFVKAIDEA